MHIPIFKDTASSDRPTRIAHTFNGLTLNNPSDNPDNTYLIELASEQVFYDSVMEPNAETDGAKSYEVRRVQAIHRLDGWVKATNLANLSDKIAALNEAFDPVLAYLNDSAVANYDRGYLPYDFDVPTADTANYATGLIGARLYLQALQRPVAVGTKFDGFQARFSLFLRAVDPVAYLQSTSTANRTGDGTLTADNSLATYPSWPIIEVAFTTAPSGDMTITRTTGDDRTITLESTELAGSKTLTLDPYKKVYEYTDGTNKIAAIQAGSRFFQLLPSSNSITLSGFPADAVITVTWRRAFV